MKHQMSILLFALSTASYTWADGLNIITHPTAAEPMNTNEVARIFLGKTKQFSDGERVQPLNLDPEHPDYEKFARKVLKKSPSQLRAYWAKQVFSGRGIPPKSYKSEEEVVALVADNAAYIGYVSEDKANSPQVNTVLVVE